MLILLPGRVEHALERAGTSVAPPERPVRSGTASVLPPAPTVKSSRARINREIAHLALYVFFSLKQLCLY
jgi:hypothetical protein